MTPSSQAAPVFIWILTQRDNRVGRGRERERAGTEIIQMATKLAGNIKRQSSFMQVNWIKWGREAVLMDGVSIIIDIYEGGEMELLERTECMFRKDCQAWKTAK